MGKKKVRKILLASALTISMISSSVLIPLGGNSAFAQGNKNPQKDLRVHGNAMTLDGEWSLENSTGNVSWNLTWDAEKSSKGYHIYHSSSEDGEYTQIATVEGKFSEGYTDSGFSIEEDSFYKIQYYKNNSVSPLSDAIKADINLDSDGDTLPDFQELAIGTDKNKVDTDDDGLPDNYELQYTLTDPIKNDTDDNGITDAEEDSDNDGLNNLKEFQIGTEPLTPDSDFDELNDGEELEKGTDPLNEDSDNDGVVDGLEEELGFDPLNPDTNGNGILDGDEQVSYETTPSSFDVDEVVTPSVTIASEASLAGTTSITNIEGTEAFLDNAPIIGAPFDFNTDINFEEAQMTFTYDPSIINGEIKPAIFYYNEETQLLEKLPNQVHNPETGQVTATVHHFSKYLLLDETKWDEIWNIEIRPPAVDEEGNIKNVDIVFSIDSSGSMAWNDPNGLRKQATKKFVDKLKEQDRAAVVDFDSYAEIVIELTNNKQLVKYAIDTIDDIGGTDLYRGVMKGVEEISRNGREDNLKYLIFLTDGDGSWNDYAIDYAKANNVVIYTIGLGSGVNQNLLKKIAESTGGKYFYATQSSELEEILEETAEETNKCLEDYDVDGLTDCMEMDGFRIGNGTIIETNPLKKDTDRDTLSDGEEVLPQYIPHNGGYYVMISDPTEKDTDFDYKNDNLESSSNRNSYNVTEHLSVFMSDLSYSNLESYIGDNGLNLETTNNKDVLETLADANIKQEHLKGWRVIKAEDSHWYDTGFGGLALKRGHQTVFAYRGTDKFEVFGDIALSDVSIALINNNWQVPIAKRFAGNTLLEMDSTEHVKVYVTGHSLGGFLAQAVSHDLIENEIHEHFLSGRKVENIQKILDRDGIFGHAHTYNAAPFIKPNFITTGLWAMLTSAIPYSRISDSKYDKYVTNHSIKGDPLSILVPNLAERFGADPTPYHEKTKDGESSHSLVQFYGVFHN